MRKLCLLAFIFVSLSSCSSLQFKYSALNYAATYDGIYNSRVDVNVPKINSFGNSYFNKLYFNNGFYWNSWQYPNHYWTQLQYGWGNVNRPFQWYDPVWTYNPTIYYRPRIIPEVYRPSVRVRGRRGSINNN